MSPHRLMSSLLFLCLPQAAGAEGLPRSYACDPTLSVFCRNIHVGCSGVTEIPTAAFEVVISDSNARVDFEGEAAPLSGRVSGSGDLVVRLEESRAWIRIQQDGRYSHRIYRDGRAAMSYGSCRRRPVG